MTALRRTYPYPEDIQAQAWCMLGAGANLLGYYMYHGGVNPDGKDTTLQEARETGYFNDLPAKSSISRHAFVNRDRFMTVITS